MTMEYTDDEISGRSILSKFRHLKDWVVEKINAINDKVDAMDVSTAVADVGITYDSTPEYKTDLKIDLKDKDGNTIGTKTVIYSAKTCEIVTPNTDKVPASIDAVRNYVEAHGGQPVNVDELLGLAKDSGFVDSSWDPGENIIDGIRLLKQIRKFNASGGDKEFGVPIAKVEPNSWVFINGDLCLWNVSKIYEKCFKVYGTDAQTEYGGQTYDKFDADTKTAWGLEDGKSYLFLTYKSNFNEAVSSIQGTIVGQVASCDMFEDPMVHQSTRVVRQYTTAPSTFVDDHIEFGSPYQEDGRIITYSCYVTDDQSVQVPCIPDIRFINDEDTIAQIYNVVPLYGQFANTDPNHYTVFFRAVREL